VTQTLISERAQISNLLQQRYGRSNWPRTYPANYTTIRTPVPCLG
jgi:hypothetical protein